MASLMNPRLMAKVPLATRQAIDRLTYAQCLKIVRFADEIHPYTKGWVRDYLYDHLKATRDALGERGVSAAGQQVGWPQPGVNPQRYANLYIPIPPPEPEQSAPVQAPPQAIISPPKPKPSITFPSVTPSKAGYSRKLAVKILNFVSHHNRRKGSI